MPVKTLIEQPGFRRRYDDPYRVLNARDLRSPHPWPAAGPRELYPQVVNPLARCRSARNFIHSGGQNAESSDPDQ